MRSDRLQLVIGSAMAGITATVFLLIVERHLGLVGFEPIAHLWTIWSICAAVLTFSVEQSVIRESARRGGKFFTRGRVAALVSVCLGLLIFASIARRRLFPDDSIFFALAAASIPIGSLSAGITRGRWASLQRFDRVALIVGSENTTRLLAATFLILIGTRAVGFAGAILFGFAIVLVRPKVQADNLEATQHELPATGEIALESQAASMFGVTTVSALCSHVSLTFAPTLVALGGGEAAATSALFLVLALVRAPLLLVFAMLPAISVHINSLVRDNNQRSLTRIRAALLFVPLGLAIPAAITCFTLLPKAAELVFDADELTRPQYALAGAAVLLGTSVVFNTTFLVAIGRVAQQATLWVTCVSASLIILIVLSRTSDITWVLAFSAGVQAVMLLGCRVISRKL